MDNSTCAEFRQAVCNSFTHAGNGLMNLRDAVTSNPQANSLVEYSLAPAFACHWTSLYSSLTRGRIDPARLQAALAGQVNRPVDGERVVLAVDSSSIARPDSYTSADRPCIYIPNLPQCRNPTTCVWPFSTLAVTPTHASSWCYPRDVQRIASDQTPAAIAAAQLRAVVPLLPARPLVVGGRGYGRAPFVRTVADVACDVLARIAPNRVAYCPPPPPTGTRGRHTRDGAVFWCADGTTHGTPDEQWDGTTPTKQPLHVAAWHNLHFQKAHGSPFTLLRVERPTAPGKKRDPRTSWCIWCGTTPRALPTVWTTYLRRSSLAHTFRFLKQDVQGGESPRAHA